MKRVYSTIGLCGLLCLSALGCGDRPDIYDTPVSANAQSFALTNRVAVLDNAANRVGVFIPTGGQNLDRQFFPIGKNAVRSEVSPDAKRLFVLSAGDVPRRKNQNEKASLTVLDDGGGVRSFDLESPHSGFALDPQGRYVALFAQPGSASVSSAFVENPNEVVIVDLESPDPGAAVTPRTFRSFGGTPQRVSFTNTLNLPGGTRRLLVVETDQDVHLLDLDNIRATPARPEITVRLTSGESTNALKPAGVVVDDGDGAKNDDARIGIRVSNAASVFTLTLVPQLAGATSDEPGTVPNDFRPEVNLTEVGGIPGDIVFVRTDLGLRLAAVVPSTQKVVLFDPTTSITNEVDINGSFSKISLITNVVSSPNGTDTALLYGAGSGGSTSGGGYSTNGVAFLSLGKAVGQTYRTVEVVSLATSIGEVRDVPPPRPELKVLQGSANGFFVLNLASRTAAPLTTLQQPTIHVAPDGQRLWAYRPGSEDLAAVTLDNLHPIPLTLDRPISSVYDVARADGGRALIALDLRGNVGATVIDALAPDTTSSHSYYGLMLEGLK